MKKNTNITGGVLLVLLLACVCAAQKKDLPVWEAARWGMTGPELLAAFGSKLEKLPKREEYGEAYADYVLRDFELEDDRFDAFFQMDNKTNRLAQVFLKYKRIEADAALGAKFERLEKRLDKKYGPADQRVDKNESGVISRSRQWKLKTTTVELSYLWFNLTGAVVYGVRYFPSEPAGGGGTKSGSGQGVGNGTGNKAETIVGVGDGSDRILPGQPVGGVVQRLKIISKPKASYTDEAEKNRIQGSVTLRVMFMADGKIGAIQPVAGLPFGLTEKAVEAARRIKFEPATRNGVPYTTAKIVVYNFKLY